MFANGVIAQVAGIANEAWVGAGLALVVGIIAYVYVRSRPPRRTPEDLANPYQVPWEPARLSPFADAGPSTPSAPRAVSDDALIPVALPPAPTPASFQIPPPPKGIGAATWVPAGQSVQVAGLTIPGGMIYFGTSLPTPYGSNDPCLIDPTKSVAKNGDYTENQMGYWPEYGAISPQERRAYLNWLAGGRRDPEATVGFVFLFFYGLERRAIVDGSKDAAARADWPVIASELRRLLGIYGKNSGSFRRYAGELLDWVSLADHPPQLYTKPIPTFPETFGLPLYIRLALGQAAVDRVPVPPNLALAWARLDPNISLRMPAKRCAEEFEKLFVPKYTELRGGGIMLPRNRTKLKLAYRPASSGFRGYEDLQITFEGIPDVTVLSEPARKLQAVVELATKPLESFSRLVGKDPEAKSSIEALLLLPAALWSETVLKAIDGLKSSMDDGLVLMSFQNLVVALGGKTALTKEKTLSLARALESTNIGFEPDVLSGSKPPKPDDHVVLFALPPSEPAPRANGPYLVAALTLEVASAVAWANGEIGIQEMEHLRDAVMSWNHLSLCQTRRLLAHLHLLKRSPASLTALKKRFEPLDPRIKETIAAFMATVAQANGEVSPAEVKMLEKVYRALGVDAKKVFTDVHAVAVGQRPSATAEGKAQRASLEETGFTLDPARIAALQRESEQVSTLLANIFTDSDVPTAAPGIDLAESEVEEEASDAPAGMLGLDMAHSALARMILSRPRWSRDELLDVAADLDMMLDGALERINEAAFDMHDMPLFEGDDPVAVNAEILEKVET